MAGAARLELGRGAGAGGAEVVAHRVSVGQERAIVIRNGKNYGPLPMDNWELPATKVAADQSPRNKALSARAPGLAAIEQALDCTALRPAILTGLQETGDPCMRIPSCRAADLFSRYRPDVGHWAAAAFVPPPRTLLGLADQPGAHGVLVARFMSRP